MQQSSRRSGFPMIGSTSSGGCKSPALEFASVVVKGWTEFVEADYETRSDCHRVACDD